MKFSLDKNLTFEQAKALFFEQLGDWKIMALASSVNDYVMVRNVSCLFYNDKIYFKTDTSSLHSAAVSAAAASPWQ